MRKIIITLLSSSLLWGCCDVCNIPSENATVIEYDRHNTDVVKFYNENNYVGTIRTVNFEHNNHSYILFLGINTSNFSIVHNPNCKCMENYIKKDKSIWDY